MQALNQQLETSSVQLEALNTWVTGLVEGLQHQVMVGNVESTIQPILRKQTHRFWLSPDATITSTSTSSHDEGSELEQGTQGCVASADCLS